jgi:hypothetical protein
VSPRSPWLTQDGRLVTAGAVVATAEAVVASTEELLAGVVSTVAVLLVGSTAEASAVARSTAVLVSVGDASAVVVFVVAVLADAIGMATGAITDSLMTSSSAASAFRVGGAGAIRTDITGTTITPTITMAMDTAGTHTAMDTATHTATTMATADTVTMVAAVTDTAMVAEPVMDTALETDQGISGVRGVGDKPGYSLQIWDEATLSRERASVPGSVTSL